MDFDLCHALAILQRRVEIAELHQHMLLKDYPGLDLAQMNIYLVEGLDRVLPPMLP